MSGSRNQWIELAARITVLAFLVIGCFVVLMPFVSALMWAGIVCFSTWPLYVRIDRLFRGRHTLAALTMILLISSVLAVPFVCVTVTLADNSDQITQMATTAVNGGIPNPPEWLHTVPKVGPEADRVWREWAQNHEKIGAI